MFSWLTSFYVEQRILKRKKSLLFSYFFQPRRIQKTQNKNSRAFEEISNNNKHGAKCHHTQHRKLVSSDDGLVVRSCSCKHFNSKISWGEISVGFNTIRVGKRKNKLNGNETHCTKVMTWSRRDIELEQRTNWNQIEIKFQWHLSSLFDIKNKFIELCRVKISVTNKWKTKPWRLLTFSKDIFSIYFLIFFHLRGLNECQAQWKRYFCV